MSPSGVADRGRISDGMRSKQPLTPPHTTEPQEACSPLNYCVKRATQRSSQKSDLYWGLGLKREGWVAWRGRGAFGNSDFGVENLPC
ncbi:unnamed protein product [Pieris brassicae]|uniref:Uncharacterized protein n=1 Tax=Pieris brassicae TaxID=7116 RepID=A0A9P0TE26_PIEBR|nr:unnamed protein product [Pieris brassicae]